MRGFPPRCGMLVEHMILQHHGHLEFGSQGAQFPEAMLLHYLDDLDSKMECMRVLVDGTVWWRVTSPATAHPWSAQF